MLDAGSARRQSWLVYALGSGLGHVVRAISLQRAARRRGHDVRILASSAEARGLPVDVTWLPQSADRTAITRQIRRCALERSWDALVVDTFPRGILGELAPLLPAISCPKVLVHRDISPAYWERFGLEELVQEYDLVLLPGESGPLRRHPRVAATDAWLVRDVEDLLDRHSARARLGIPANDARPLILVSASGTSGEMRAARGLAGRVEARFPGAVVRLADPASDQGVVWPLLEVLRGVDVLVGAGGYNTVHESRATGTPFVALPRPRLYDRQARRLAESERASDEETLVDRVERILASPSQRPPPTYRNGAYVAARLIEEVAAGRDRLSPPPIS